MPDWGAVWSSPFPVRCAIETCAINPCACCLNPECISGWILVMTDFRGVAFWTCKSSQCQEVQQESQQQCLGFWSLHVSQDQGLATLKVIVFIKPGTLVCDCGSLRNSQKALLHDIPMSVSECNTYLPMRASTGVHDWHFLTAGSKVKRPRAYGKGDLMSANLVQLQGF